MDETLDFVLRVRRMESLIESAKISENQARQVRESLESELRRMQQQCKHENVKINGHWQGDNLYYENVHCQICNKEDGRYNRELTLQKRREWYKHKTEQEIQDMTPQKSDYMFGKYDW